MPVAYLLAMKRFPGKRLLEVLLELPMVLPPTVAGVGLLLAFGRQGLAGGALCPPRIETLRRTDAPEHPVSRYLDRKVVQDVGHGSSGRMIT